MSTTGCTSSKHQFPPRPRRKKTKRRRNVSDSFDLIDQAIALTTVFAGTLTPFQITCDGRNFTVAVPSLAGTGTSSAGISEWQIVYNGPDGRLALEALSDYAGDC